ncbi:MAG TPA: hypothetical protein VIM61_05500 [Chthoniobacterales bacterium]
MTFRPSLSRAGLALFLALGALLVFLPQADAQVRVDLGLRRSLFIRYEPVIATVTITNLSGRDIELNNVDNHKWFSFNIVSVQQGQADSPVPPYNADYSLDPVTIPAGQSLKRAVNITPLYPITEYGIYRVRATIYEAQSRRFYSSNPPLNIEITEGRTLWEQTVGVPANQSTSDGVETRTLTLLTHRLPDQTQLYLRIQDKERGLIYCTHQLGRVVSFNKPQVEIDANNDIHILQNTSPRMFLYTKVGLDGKILDRKQYSGSTESTPTMRRTVSGDFRVMGGTFLDPNQIAEEKAAPPPSVSDRPVSLPKPQ